VKVVRNGLVAVALAGAVSSLVVALTGHHSAALTIALATLLVACGMQTFLAGIEPAHAVGTDAERSLHDASDRITRLSFALRHLSDDVSTLEETSYALT
jgi:hypothetical protein